MPENEDGLSAYVEAREEKKDIAEKSPERPSVTLETSVLDPEKTQKKIAEEDDKLERLRRDV